MDYTPDKDDPSVIVLSIDQVELIQRFMWLLNRIKNGTATAEEKAELECIPEEIKAIAPKAIE